jgi:hypothetical protein
MNEQTRFVVQLYQFTLLIRDTIFYGFHREFSDVVSYQTRQKQLEMFLNEKGIIRQILTRLPDQGIKITEKVDSFMNLFYREPGKALQIKEEKLIFSLSYIHLLYDHVIVLHQIFTDILKSYLKSPQITEHVDIPIQRVIDHDQVFFKSLLLLGIVNEIDFHSALLKSLSKKLQDEPNSDPKPKENIQKRLHFFITVLLDQKRRNQLEDVGLQNVYVEAENLVNMVQGKIPTPTKDGPPVIKGKPTGAVVNGELRMFLNEVIAMLRDQITLVRNISEQQWLAAFNDLKTNLEDTNQINPAAAA